MKPRLLSVPGLILVALLAIVAVFSGLYGCGGPPVSSFEVSISSGQAPLTVDFVNKSKNANSFKWDFGDGDTMTTATTKEQVTHQFTKSGNLAVTLTATQKSKKADVPDLTNSTTITIAVQPGPLAKVVITPAQVSSLPAADTSLKAEAQDQYGNVIPEAQVSWEAAAAAGSITSGGVLTTTRKSGVFDAGVTVTASHGGQSAKATALVTINPGPLARVTVSPAQSTLTPGKGQAFAAQALDAYENPVPGVKLTWEASADAGSVTQEGNVTAGTKAGSYENAITATATKDGLSAKGAASLTVNPDPLETVTLAAAEVAAGEVKQLDAVASDKYGNRITAVELAFSVMDANAGTVTPAGSLTAGLVARSFPDTLRVQASQGQITRTATVGVTIRPGPLEQVVVAPGRAEIGMEMTQQFVAVGADKYGNRIQGLSFAWSVVNGGGTIDASSGLFKAAPTPRTYSKTVKAEARQGDIARSGTADVVVESDRIAFYSTRDNDQFDLYLMDIDGTNVRNLTNTTTVDEWGATWSADGRRIAYYFQDIQDTAENSTSQIMVTDDQGQWTFNLSGTQWAVHPAWSADGKRIAYAVWVDDNWEIYVMDADGANPTRLTNNASDDYSPAWSPDGSRIAFVAERDGNEEIYAMYADGSGQRRLTDSPWPDIVPSWSPDGTEIAYQSGASGARWSISLMNADGTGRHQLTGNNYSANYPSWSPDGKKIVFHSFRDSSTNPGIYTMDPTGENIVRISRTAVPDYAPTWAPRKKGIEVNEASIVIPDAKALRPMTVQEVAALARKAVVRVETDLGKGSGFIIDPNGLIMTANHVISGAREINVFLEDGIKYAATVKGRDLVRDIAVIEIKATGLPFLKLGDLSQTGLGQGVVVLGYPLDSTQLTVTSGLVSALRTDSGRVVTWVQTDSAINWGNSGGPLLNLQGEVIGVVTMKSVGFGVENVGYAVSINSVKPYLERMESGQTIY